MEKMEKLTQEFSRYRTAYCTAKALKEEVSKLIARLEQIPEAEALKRIESRVEDLFNELKSEQ